MGETAEAAESSCGAAGGRSVSRRRRSTRGRQATRGRGSMASGLGEEDRLRVSRLQEERRLMTQVRMDIL